MKKESKEIKIASLRPSRYHSGQFFREGRLSQLAESIEDIGLISPITVWSDGSGMYELLGGHNRVEAVKALGKDTIIAEIFYDLPEEDARRMYFDSNLNQQTFSDWNYTQKFEAAKYIDELIKKNSQQGRRNDLKKNAKEPANATSVQTRQKLEPALKQTTRDRMANKFGISAATLGKYRRIIKLPDELVQSLARLLDAKRITFEDAYIAARLSEKNIADLIRGLDEKPKAKINRLKLKAFRTKKDEKKNKKDDDVLEVNHSSKKPLIESVLEESDDDEVFEVERIKPNIKRH